MQRKWMFLFTALVLFSLMLSPMGTASAQDPLPPTPPAPEPRSGPTNGPQQDENGNWYKPAGAQAMALHDAGPLLATGGPDDFGYTWDDTVAFSWIDISGGTDTGLAGDDQFTGPYDIGFPFKFYENTYTQFYASTNGLVSFGQGFKQCSNQPIPNPALPNNFVASFWDDLTVGSSYNPGKVYYQPGGTAPNQYLVVEWYNVTSCCSQGATDYKTFEVVLYENGDIVFQYLSLSGNLQSATGGIEDSMGENGLQYLYNAPGLANNKAVRFYRPPASAHVSLSPAYQGRFTQAGATESFQITVRNTGDLGTDTYDLTAVSTWPVTFNAANGLTPLTDTDGDGTVDTGPVAQGNTVTVTAKVATPVGPTVGNANTATITARSSLNTSKSKTATLQTAVPAPFAQIYRDNADGAMSFYMAQPNSQTVKKATPDSYYGLEMAVTASPNGNFVYVWRYGRHLDSCNIYVDEIEYTLLDHYGQTVRGVSKLTDHSGATMHTYDQSPSVAVAPNGTIGVAWYRYLYNSANSQFNYNIYFATLDGAGNLLSGPTNMTNNAIWGTDSDPNIPRFWASTIASSDDNRFIISWYKYSGNPSSAYNIWYATRDTAGSEVFAPTALTSDNSSYKPILNSLTGGKAILTWYRSVTPYYGAPYYAVLNSNGTVFKTATYLGVSGIYVTPDAVLVPGGKVAVAWGTYTGVQFAILDTSYNRVVGPTSLNNPAALLGNGSVSVTADSAGHAIITWIDVDWSYRQNLYYALVDGSGNTLTAPMIFSHSQSSSPYIETSINGQGNVPYTKFVDVPITYWAYSMIERLYAAGFTTGCSLNPLAYCPERSVTRAEMAVFIERGIHGAAYIPPAGTGAVFADVLPGYWAFDWIEKLYADQITSGCSLSPLSYCPERSITRAEMAVFLLKAKHGAAYNPPAAVGIFADVPTNYWAASWIERLYAEGITGGCSLTPLSYCPESPVTRAEMAVFLVLTFNLP